jgi:hypothetical protein
MFRLFFLVALAGLLAACTTQGDAQATQSPNPSAPDSSGSARTATGEPSAACAEAFAPLAELELTSTSDLGELAEVELTVASCESVADWMAGAQQVVENEVSPGAADLLLRIRCEAGSLSRTPICEELN